MSPKSSFLVELPGNGYESSAGFSAAFGGGARHFLLEAKFRLDRWSASAGEWMVIAALNGVALRLESAPSDAGVLDGGDPDGGDPDGGGPDGGGAPGVRAVLVDETGGTLAPVRHPLLGEPLPALGSWHSLVIEVWLGATPRVRAQLGSASLAETDLVAGGITRADAAESVGDFARIGVYSHSFIACAARYDDVLVHLE